MEIDAGTRALITGASKGIGAALAAELAGRGVRVGLLARDQRALDELAGRLPGEQIVLPADVTEPKELERAVGAFVDEAGGLDLLVANAGIAHYGPFAEMDLAKIESMVSVNVMGSLYTVKAALPSMLDGGAGHIVVVSSGAGIRAFPDGAVYGATKAANRGFAEALRHELAGTGVSLTTVYPGEVATELHSHQLDRLPDWRQSDEAIDPSDLATEITDAVQEDRRSVFAPKAVRLLGMNGVAPGATDRLLRRVRGQAAAPRRD
ncbi:MAG TPA: SDR family oxidoreductase [Solirubrobacterales bacterium]|nr:SDR family oxidoreductase [Solirubrobacterales bacterium]